MSTTKLSGYDRWKTSEPQCETHLSEEQCPHCLSWQTATWCYDRSERGEHGSYKVWSGGHIDCDDCGLETWLPGELETY